MSRALWHNAEMHDGVKRFLATHLQLLLVCDSMLHHGGLLGCPLVYQHHHGTFSKGHIKSFHERAEPCGTMLRT